MPKLVFLCTRRPGLSHAAYAQHLLAGGVQRAQVVPVLDLFCRNARRRIDESFRGTRDNDDARGYALAQDVLAGAHAWLEAAR